MCCAQNIPKSGPCVGWPASQVSLFELCMSLPHSCPGAGCLLQPVLLLFSSLCPLHPCPPLLCTLLPEPIGLPHQNVPAFLELEALQMDRAEFTAMHNPHLVSFSARGL